MEAVEFFKEVGISKARDYLKTEMLDDEAEFYFQLKRLIESHEYIESFGGLREAKRTFEMRDGIINLDGWYRLKIAIIDVEKCL